MRSFRLALAFGAALLGAAACSDPAGPSGGGGDPGPPHMVIVSGDAQQGTVGAELAAPLVVRVMSDKGKPVSGQVVNFVVVSGGGHVFAGASITDGNGEARERWTLGTVAADSQKLEVRAVDNATGAPLVFGVFRATARADVPASVGPAGSTNFAGLPSLPLADSVGAVVRDRFGNTVPGVAVVWTVPRGGGSASPPTSNTGADGVARTRWTLGPRVDSAQVLQAAAGLTVTTQFTANAPIPLDATLVKVSGDNQSDSVGRVLAQPLVVRVQRADGTPLAGVPVTFEVGGGSLNPASVASGPDGLAQTRWTLPTTIGGTASAVAKIANVAPVSFTAFVIAGPAVSLQKAAGEGQSGVPGTVLRDSLTVLARDQYGNAVPGVQVAWSAAVGAVSPAASATRANGTTRAAYTLPGAPGTYTVQAAAPGLAPVAFTAVATFASPVYMTLLSPAAGATVGDTLAVSVRIDSVPGTNVNRVWASVAGRTVMLAALPAVGTTVTGKVPLDGLPLGALEVQVKATTVAGDSAFVSRTFTRSVPVGLRVVAPVNGQVLRDLLQVSAFCVDPDAAGCASMRATMRPIGTVPPGVSAQTVELATGTSSIATAWAMAAYAGAVMEVAVTASGAHGEQYVSRDTVYVENDMFTISVTITRVGRLVLDADSTRTLYMDSTGAILLRTGANDQQVSAPIAVRSAFLHPYGAAFWNAGTLNAFDWRDGTAHALGHVDAQIRARGGWMIWSSGAQLFRRDLAASTTQQIASDAVNVYNDVAANGDVVYAAGGASAGQRYDIYRYRDGVATALTSDADDAHWNLWPVTDGTSVVYFKSDQAGNAATLQNTGHITLLRDGVETTIGASVSAPTPGRDYAISGGWVAYVSPNGAGVPQVHVRAPGGADYLVYSAAASIAALGPNGRLIFSSGGMLYHVRAPYTGPRIPVGHDFGTPPGGTTEVKFVGDLPLIFVGREVIRVSQELQ